MLDQRASSLLEPLTSAELCALMAFSRPMSFPDGAVLFSQGSPPDGCFLVQAGEVALSSGLPGGTQTPVAVVGVDDLLGEGALVSQAPRVLTATAVGEVWALHIEAKNIPVLRSLISPLHSKFLLRVATSLARRLAMVLQFPLIPDGPGAALDPERAPLGHSERPGSSIDLSSFFPLLSCFRELTSADIEGLTAVSQVWELARGRWLFAAGDAADKAFFTVRGACETRWRGQPAGRRLTLLGPGKVIDPVELLLGGERRVDCRVRERSVVLALPHAAFHSLLERESAIALKLLSAATHELLERLTRATRLIATRDLIVQLSL